MAASLSRWYELTLSGGMLLMRKRKDEVEAEPLADPCQLRLALEYFEHKEQLTSSAGLEPARDDTCCTKTSIVAEMEAGGGRGSSS